MCHPVMRCWLNFKKHYGRLAIALWPSA